MAQNDDTISLRISLGAGATTAEEHEPHDEIEDDTFARQQEDSRQYESKRKRACVLLGSAIAQLPIWGFAMNYGVFQEYYSENWTFHGSQTATGVIGTTANGVIYLSIPLLSALFTRRWARHRRLAALAGSALLCASFLLSSFSTQAWHLVATQGVLASLGGALIYSPTTLSLGEWFTTANRAVAYGVTLSCKNVVGSATPFLLRALLDKHGFPATMRIWTAIAGATSLLAIWLIPTHPSRLVSAVAPPPSERSEQQRTRPRRSIPWSFLRHQTIYIYTAAIVLQSAGYGIPQTYLNTYAHEITRLSQTSATLLLTLFNAPGIVACVFFGWLSDNKRFTLSADTIAAVSAVSSALSALLFWGLTGPGSVALLVLFSTTYGFFAGGYSSTWGSMLTVLEREASAHNEALDTGMVYGLLNGARGIGYVAGGLAGVPLLKVGTLGNSNLGYGSTYGPLIVFTGLSTVFGGWGVLWR